VDPHLVQIITSYSEVKDPPKRNDGLERFSNVRRDYSSLRKRELGL
jgi:hypothetical protein